MRGRCRIKVDAMMSYFKEIAVGFWSLLAGMAVTIRYFVKPIVTVQYPRQKIADVPEIPGLSPVYHRSRDRHPPVHRLRNVLPHLPVPTDHRGRDEVPGEKQKRATKYLHEHQYCSLCGLCVEVCPTTALEFSKEYRLAGFRREDCVIDHLILLQKRQKAAGSARDADSHGGGHRRGRGR